MSDEFNNNNNNISTDNIRRKRINMDNNKDNYNQNDQVIQESRSQANMNYNDNSDIIDNDNDNEKVYNNTYKDESPYLQYKTQYNTIDGQDLNQNSNKKKVGKKVNRNFKLLKIIKERMKEQKYKTILEKNKENKMNDNNINNNNNDKESFNKENNEKDDEKKLSKNEEKEKKAKATKTLDEEKRRKLLGIFNSKKYNKFQRKENKNKPKQIEKEGKEEKEEKDQKDNNNLDNKQILNDNNNKNNEEDLNKKEESDEIKKDNNENNDSQTTRKNKFTNESRSKTTPLLNTLNDKKRSSSSNKGALEILELLKMRKKKEDNDKLDSKDKRNYTTANREPIEYNNNNNYNYNNKRIIRKIDSYKFKPKKRLVEKYKKDRDRHLEIASSLPRKSFRDEEEDDDDGGDFHNRTTLQFHNNNNKNDNNDNNDSNDKQYQNNNDNKNWNHFNISNKRLNLNSSSRSINSLNNTQILSKTNRAEKMYNPINIKNKFRNQLQYYNTINNDDYDKKDNSLFRNIIDKADKVVKKKETNRSLDKSYDYVKRPMNIRDKNLLNKRIYKPKIVSINNSPERLNQYENNTIATDSVAYDMMKCKLANNSKSIKPPKTYVKRSLENYTNDYTDSANNKTIDTIASNNNNNNNTTTTRTIYKKNSKNMINNLNKNKSYVNSRAYTNNKFATIDAIDTKEPNINYFYSNNNNSRNIQSNRTNLEKSNSMMFNLEDLMVLEEKLNDIIISLESKDNIENKCINFWNYYYNCSLYNLLEKIFKNEEDSNIVRLSINYKLLSIMVCYEFSFQINESDQEIYLLLLELMDLNYDNLMIICEYILTRIDPVNKQNIWVLKLEQKIRKNKDENTYIKKTSQNSIEKIDYNINSIKKKLKNILLNYTTVYSDLLISLLKEIDTKSYEEINDFFRKNILRVDNFEGSIMASSYLKEKKLFKSLPAPYLTYPPQKPYTLVLDLDETLVHFKIKTSKGGTLRARPFLFGFLEEMGQYYELIVWTSATEAYANSLINAVEHDKKYFDYILFREHATIIGEDFVKDLTRIGRNLNRIIIIDDMPQNFRLQKENGINIKPFFGDDMQDTALYELVPILKQIAQDGNDVRIGLDKYREEIVRKVTSNISRQNLY